MTGEYLRTKIISSGYQQVEVAEKLGITPQNLESKLQAKDIKVSFLLDVARAINKNIYYFVSEFLEENNSNEEEISNKTKNEKIKITKPLDDFILLKIANVLSSELLPHFEISQKNLDILTESQSRVLLNQGELLDKIEELVTILTKEKNIN
ncbi:hypothetical protein ACSTS3_22615 [Aquimarina muelleri]|uniref:hypothetical protein n=1 Tax=Aquimarina muelleri TaxID=279356 RepID=UPI003F6882CC